MLTMFVALLAHLSMFWAAQGACNVPNPSYLGDGYCDMGDYNTEDCEWDGGDCCEATCTNSTYVCGTVGYDCKGCHAPNTEWLGDGYCDIGVYNTEECGWDGGDCCETTCVSSDTNTCGRFGYDCKNHLFISSIIRQGSASAFEGNMYGKAPCFFSSEQCMLQAYDVSENLAHASNGALPAVAKDSIGGHSDIHDPAYLNDGTYGNGASWISDSTWSWVKVKLGGPATVDGIRFGRDRLGYYDDRDPGQIKIYIAEEDNVYANGDDTLDKEEYTLVFDSSLGEYSGAIVSGETLEAKFNPTNGQYVKIEVQNFGACFDEIEVSGARYLP